MPGDPADELDEPVVAAVDDPLLQGMTALSVM